MSRLKNKYRFVVLNDKTFEEKASFSLKGFNVIAAIGGIAFILMLITYTIIAFTPLREYIPGYADLKTQRKVNKLLTKTDSLESALDAKHQYLANLKNIMTGNIGDSVRRETKPQANDEATDKLNLYSSSAEDSMLREQYKNRDPYELMVQRGSGGESRDPEVGSLNFFLPLDGIITDKFNPANGHYAVDMVGPSNSGIKSVLDGKVIFADYTAGTGHVIIVQHFNHLLSVYKHNSVLLKKVGNFVEAGELIAIIGETGELSTGPHLHFELWHDGKPLDPEQYLAL